jgi:DNA-directed RNA polymerase specialized sigma24 family protein
MRDMLDDDLIAGIAAQQGLVRRYLSRCERDAGEIAEQSQQVMAIALEHRLEFNGSGSLEGWLLMICRSVRHRELRRLRRGILSEVTDEYPDPGPPLDESLIPLSAKLG